jgi:hypothetical protein
MRRRKPGSEGECRRGCYGRESRDVIQDRDTVMLRV